MGTVETLRETLAAFNQNDLQRGLEAGASG
jgi:hypothetical protein